MRIRELFTARDMTQGRPWKRIMEFAVPMLIGNLAQQLYNTVDSIVVGEFVAGVLGGALGAYLSTFFLKYRRDSLFIMALMPVIATLNIYLFLSGFYMRLIF